MTLNRDVWDGKRPIVDSAFGSRSIGPFALITEGCDIWTDPDQRKNSHENPVGGIVLEVTTSPPNDDGEIVRSFRTYDYLAPWQSAFRTIGEHEIERDSITGCDPGRLVRTCRRFWRELAKHETSMLDTAEARLAADAQRLVNILMGGQW